MINIGLLGCGYWGHNLARNLLSLKGASLKKICDTDEKRLAYARKNFPMVEAVKDADMILKDKDIDAVVIALPVKAHHVYAKNRLRQENMS